jgi:hypothetical protein
LVNHAHQFEDIHLFNQQGVEKFNDLAKAIFFGSTDRRDYIRQLLWKSLRTDKLRDELKDVIDDNPMVSKN